MILELPVHLLKVSRGVVVFGRPCMQAHWTVASAAMLLHLDLLQCCCKSLPALQAYISDNSILLIIPPMVFILAAVFTDLSRFANTEQMCFNESPAQPAGTQRCEPCTDSAQRCWSLPMCPAPYDQFMTASLPNILLMALVVAAMVEGH